MGRDGMTLTDAFDAYDEWLNNQDVEVAGITFEAARVIRELDPIAYRTGFSDWCDGMGYDPDLMTGSDWRDDV